MRIVVDENVPQAQAFSSHGELIRLPGRSLRAEDVRDADALIVRSITQVDAQLLAGSRVAFVGTCTIGIDHLDTHWLDGQGIAWTNAPGCNARSVTEYVLAALRLLSVRRAASLAQRCYGIVGVGEVGQRLASLLQGLGWQVLLCDPPRAAGGAAPGVEAAPDQSFVGLDELIERCDVICLHTPLTTAGDWPTRHLMDVHRLRRLRQGCWLINAGRGPVIDNVALLAVLQERDDLAVVLDVWEHEPVVEPRLAARCELVTPHIAGYSLDGKIRGTEMIYQAFCRHFALAAGNGVRYPAAEITHLGVGQGVTAEQLLGRLSVLFYDPLADDAALRATLGLQAQARAAAFDRLRKQYPVRREMTSTCLQLPVDAAQLQQVARALSMPWQWTERAF